MGVKEVAAARKKRIENRTQRMCAGPQCATRLSIYNDDDTCSTCGPVAHPARKF